MSLPAQPQSPRFNHALQRETRDRVVESIEIVNSKRNYSLASDRKDGLIEWMREMMYHSFVLNSKESYVGTMIYFEELIEECTKFPDRNRLKQYVPSVSTFYTPLPLSRAFSIYDDKYSISQRDFISPSFNEIRHILNLAQVMAIGQKLELISFDGDQTLYSDGGNFEENEELASAIISLLIHGVKVALITAAGYGLDGSKYEMRLKGLLSRFISDGLDKNEVENFYVFGGECNYLMQCTLTEASAGSIPSTGKAFDVYSGVELQPASNTDASITNSTTTTTTTTAPPLQINPSSSWDNSDIEEQGLASDVGEGEEEGEKGAKMTAKLIPVPVEDWQAPHVKGPKPFYWDQDQVTLMLDVAEKSMRDTVQQLNLRAKILRKDRAVGVFPGGDAMCASVPKGHGSKKLKKEALEELVLRVMDSLRKQSDPAIKLPYCVFNGGRDAWLDVGNKSVAVEALQAFLNFSPENCLHVGDQFLKTGNDLAARNTCPCIWITSPHETGKVLQHVLKTLRIMPRCDSLQNYY